MTQDSEALTKAKRIRDEAEIAWVNGDYDTADKLIIDTYSILNQIRQDNSVGVGWWMYVFIVAAVIVLGAGAWLVIRRRKYKYFD